MLSPTPTAAALLALGLLPAALPGGAGIAAGWDLALLALVLLDACLAPGPAALAACRAFREPLSAFAPNRITLLLRSTGRRALAADLADAPPASFDSSAHRRSVRLPPGAELGIAYDAVPRERGTVRFGDLHLRTRGPLGLARWSFRLPLAREARVYPDLRALSLPAAASSEAARPRRLGLREGSEFESLRPYAPGDDVRAIDWKATARRAAPIVRRWQPERNQVVWILLDTGRALAGRLPDGRTKLDRAVDAALAVARAASARGDRVGVLLFAAEVTAVVPPGAGRAQLGPIAEALHGARASGEEADYRAAFDAFEARQRRRALVLLLTDLADPDTSAPLIARAALLRRRHLVVVAAADDSAVREAATTVPGDDDAAWRRVAATRILRERDAAAARLAAAGVLVESCAASTLAAAVAARYADVKSRGLL